MSGNLPEDRPIHSGPGHEPDARAKDAAPFARASGLCSGGGRPWGNGRGRPLSENHRRRETIFMRNIIIAVLGVVLLAVRAEAGEPKKDQGENVPGLVKALEQQDPAARLKAMAA